MKRLFQVLGTLVLLIIIAAIVLPIIFKNEIIARAKEEINNNLSATVDFQDIDISLIRSFPDFSLSLKETTVDGQEDFEGVRLADIGRFTVELNLFSVISGSNYEIEGIELEDASFHVVIDSSGQANYDIVNSDEEAADTTASSSSFSLSLKSYELKNINLIYDDRDAEMKANIRGLHHSGKGDFTERMVDLETTTSIEKLTFTYGGVDYLSRATASADVAMQFDQETYKITFGNNSVKLNELALQFKGWLEMPEDDIAMDLSFDAPNNSFKSLLSLVPAVYAEDFASVKTSGDFDLTGRLNGVYNGDREEYPAFDFNLNINEATFRYPSLPAGVEGINVRAHIFNKSSDLDGTVIDVQNARAVVAGSPVDARLNLKTPISDPQIAAYLKTDFDLSNVGRVVPSTGFDYKGQVKATVDIATRMSDIDNERYENVRAEGSVIARSIVLKSDSLPYDVAIKTLDMQFSPQSVALNAFESQLGRSDIAMNGKIDNLLSYVLQDKTLKADFNLNSNILDLNELAGSDEEAAAQQSEGEASDLEVIRLPENINASLTANINTVIYDNLEIKDVKGLIRLQEGRAVMENVNMALLGGSLMLDGYYDSKPASPQVAMEMKIADFSFAESFDKLLTVQKLAPIMSATTGTYGTTINLKASMNPDMSPDLSSISANGKLVANNLSTSPKSLQKLADILKNQELSSLNLAKVNLSYAIENGRVKVEPFDLKAGNVTAVVSGSNGLDQSLDYTMDMKIPLSGIKSNDLLEKVGVTKNNMMDLKVLIGGTFSNPKVSTSLGDLAGNIVDNLREKAEEKVEEVKKEAIDKVNEEAARLIAEAEKKGDMLIAEAEKKATLLKSEARKQADKIRSEGDKRANQALDEAKGNPLKQAAAKTVAEGIRKEANASAAKVENEAERKADQLVEEARKEKEKLIEEARAKGEIKQ